MNFFKGMNKSMNAFRIVEPVEGHPIRRVTYSKDSMRVLVVVAVFFII